MEIERALCGVCDPTDGENCAVCLKPLCRAQISSKKSVCDKCLGEVVEAGHEVHPVTQKKIRMCKCGKPWTGECIGLSIPGTSVIDIDALLKEVPNPRDRMAAVRNPKYHISVSHLHGLV